MVNIFLPIVEAKGFQCSVSRTPNAKDVKKKIFLLKSYLQRMKEKLQKFQFLCPGGTKEATNDGNAYLVYMNKKSQIVTKLKSTHVDGAFSKNNKGCEGNSD
ncbi:PREDICTED: uncharacterized protein LOC109242283 isoform X2 [Nicotiana attenuata]|uniref:uncharacterized protein LOC109242283 isoform X2 n=1 Tax=Nicotiana attenuata TaxID=49451 RepID=UPI000905574D|nr:PREDICTED: uncharacterized protein LOC109242283 isoform X2 [Nicotiana attenuata]